MRPQHTSLVPAGNAHPAVRALLDINRDRRTRYGARALVLDGTWAVRQALAAGLPIHAVFVCRPLLRGDHGAHLVAELAAMGVAGYEVGERVFHRMSERDGPDGIAAIASLPQRTLEDVELGPSATLVVADSIELAGNLGTIIRCADGAGAAGVLVTERRLRVNHPLVVKASMGTLFSVPVVDAERGAALHWLREHAVRIVGADPAAVTSYRDAGYSGRVAVVVGCERLGLASFWKDAADVLVSIPMLGVADSLNVGHAAALLLYEALHRQRRGVPMTGARWRRGARSS